jgi:hypothetical protein
MPGVITTTKAAVDAPRFVAVHQNDPLASPLIEVLAVELAISKQGNTSLADPSLPARDIGPHPFENQLVCEGLVVEGRV